MNEKRDIFALEHHVLVILFGTFVSSQFRTPFFRDVVAPSDEIHAFECTCVICDMCSLVVVIKSEIRHREFRRTPQNHTILKRRSCVQNLNQELKIVQRRLQMLRVS